MPNQEHSWLLSSTHPVGSCHHLTYLVSQAVKDLLDELASDNLIEKDKIGSGNYFWAFPSKAITTREAKLAQYNSQIENLENGIKELTDRKRKAMEARPDTAERAATLSELSELRVKHAKLDERLKMYAANDPEKLKQLEKGVVVSRDAANRWTDNIYQVMDFYKSRMSEWNEEQFMKHFGLPVELNEVE